MNSALFDVGFQIFTFLYNLDCSSSTWHVYIKKNRLAGFESRENVVSYSYDRRRGVASPQTGRLGATNFWFDPSWNKLMCVVELG